MFLPCLCRSTAEKLRHPQQAQLLGIAPTMNAPPYQGGDATQQALQSGEAAAEPDVRTGSPAVAPDARDGSQGAHVPHESVRRGSASARAAASLMRMSQEDTPSSRRVFYDQVQWMHVMLVGHVIDFLLLSLGQPCFLGSEWSRPGGVAL